MARLCRPNERAWAASRTRLGAADLAIALVGRYTGGVTPAASLVVCADVAWTPARRGRGGREIENEAIRAYEERPYVALRVEERDGGATLVAVNADETVRTVCPVPPEDAHGTAMWADAITEALAGKC